MVGVAKEITDICEPGWKVRGVDFSGNGLSSRKITTIKDVTATPFTAEFTIGYTPVMTQLEYAFQIEDIGPGKITEVLIDNAAMLYNQGKINGLLLIAPKGVYKNWYEDQIPTHLPDYINKKIDSQKKFSDFEVNKILSSLLILIKSFTKKIPYLDPKDIFIINKYEYEFNY